MVTYVVIAPYATVKIPLVKILRVLFQTRNLKKQESLREKPSTFFEVAVMRFAVLGM